ncbi:MAG TPA: YdcF family protein [Gaiellaceae bacterium]
MFLFRWFRRLVLLVLLLAALAAASVWLFGFPRTDPAGRADAVVVLSGSNHDRLPRGLALMRAHVAPVLVVSDGARTEPRLCGRRRPYRVLCVRPNPFSTRGEAEEIARLARARGWRTVDVVTSRYHVYRARLIIKRCFHGRLRMVASTPRAFEYVEGAAAEWPKLFVAEALRRGC